MIHLLYVLIGVGMLSLGGEALIRGALAAAKRLGISPLLTGLVIVGFGTSAPELVVSVNAAIQGSSDIAVGNVIGSNIGNILLILGICAVITPLTIKPSSLKRDGLTVVGSTLLFLIISSGKSVNRGDGILFLVILLAFLYWAYITERSEQVPSSDLHKAEAEELSLMPKSVPWMVAAVIFGLLLLIFGSKVLLIGAVEIAKHFGLSDTVIGLTLIAVGTSLPELSISVIAAIRKHADVAIGNVLGSNIFNILGILGLSSILHPLSINSRILQFDQWVMLGSALILMVFVYTGRRLSRLEGCFLILGYGAYLSYSIT